MLSGRLPGLGGLEGPGGDTPPSLYGSMSIIGCRRFWVFNVADMVIIEIWHKKQQMLNYDYINAPKVNMLSSMSIIGCRRFWVFNVADIVVIIEIWQKKQQMLNYDYINAPKVNMPQHFHGRVKYLFTSIHIPGSPISLVWKYQDPRNISIMELVFPEELEYRRNK